MFEWLIALLAAAVSALFAARVWGQYATGRQGHALAWALGLSAYAAAAFIDAIVVEAGWSVGLYRAFFALAAGNVGLLGLGTVLLSARGRTAQASALLVAVGILVVAIGPLAVPLTLDTPVSDESETKPLRDWGGDVGAKAIPFSNAGRVAFLLLNIVGGLALILGAAWSWWRTRNAGVLLIGVGALFPFIGGSLSTFTAIETRVLFQFLGIVVMYAGYALSRRPHRAAAPEHAAQHS